MQWKNSKRYTILVSGASGIVGYGILKSLRGFGYQLIGTTIYDESPADCFADIVEKAPLTSSSDYLEWFIRIINQYHVDMVIPAIEADLSVWNRNRKQIMDTGTFVLLNNSELIEKCLDKWKFYTKLKEAGFKHLIHTTVDTDIDIYGFPLILKPKCGYGSRGVVKIDTREEFETYRKEIGKSLMIQEYVGNPQEEYTVSVFFDRDSNIKSMISFRRKLSKSGFTEIAEVVFPVGIADIILELAEVFKPVGPTNFQFRKHQGDWKLLEINPRISSSTSIRAAFGYNEAQMSVDYFLNGTEIMQPKIRTGKAIRYTEDYIFYDSID